MYMCPLEPIYKDIEHREEFCLGLAQYSDDEGKTWHVSETMLVIPLEGGREGFLAAGDY